jgi:Cytidylyltransferase family.
MAAAVSDQQQQAKRSGLKTRVLSAAVMLPVAVAAVWFGGWAFAALVVVAAVAMLWEWLRLPGRYAHDKMFAGGFGLLASLYFAMDGRFDWALTIVSVAPLFWACARRAISFGMLPGFFTSACRVWLCFG